MPCRVDFPPEPSSSRVSELEEHVSIVSAMLCAVITELAEIYDEADLKYILKVAEDNAGIKGINDWWYNHRNADETRLIQAMRDTYSERELEKIKDLISRGKV